MPRPAEQMDVNLRNGDHTCSSVPDIMRALGWYNYKCEGRYIVETSCTIQFEEVCEKGWCFYETAQLLRVFLWHFDSFFIR